MRTFFSALTSTLLIVGLLMLCTLTNPSSEQYVSWANSQYTQKLSEEHKTFQEFFAHLVAPTVIKETTTTQDYVLFSTFETTLSDHESLLTVGILNHFFPISVSEEASK